MLTHWFTCSAWLLLVLLGSSSSSCSAVNGGIRNSQGVEQKLTNVDSTDSEWRTITLYDVLRGDCRKDIGNKNLGDVSGDAYFMFKDK